MVRRAMAKQNSGGDANTDPKDKANKNDADDATDKGGKGTKAKTGADQGDDDLNEKKFSQSDLDAALARDRQDRRRAQNKVDTPSSKKKKEESDDDDGEAERHRKRAEAAEERLRQHDARDKFEDELKAAGFKNPRKMFKLLKDDLTYDDKGRPDNIKDLIAIARRDYDDELDPEADPKKPKGSADGGAKGGATGKTTSMNDFIRRAAGRQ
jgi:hypothetical protein